MQCIQLYTRIQILPGPHVRVEGGGTGMAGKYYPGAVPSCHFGYTYVLLAYSSLSATLFGSNLYPAIPPTGLTGCVRRFQVPSADSQLIFRRSLVLNLPAQGQLQCLPQESAQSSVAAPCASPNLIELSRAP